MGLASPFHRIAFLIAQFPFFGPKERDYFFPFCQLLGSFQRNEYFQNRMCEKKKIKKKFFKSKHGMCAFHGIHQWWKSHVGNFKPKEKKRPINFYFNRSCDFQWSWITRILLIICKISRVTKYFFFPDKSITGRMEGFEP